MRKKYYGESLEPGDPRHGTMGGYSYYQCRCDECCKARSDSDMEAKRRRKAQLEADPTLAPHGSSSTYTNWMCRCELCSEAANNRNRRYRMRRPQWWERDDEGGQVTDE